MCATAIFDPLAELLDRDCIERCRFCGCTEENACAIPIAEGSDGKQRLARSNEEVLEVIPCSWYLEECCNAPACLEKLIAESRVLLFAPDGRKLA
jgi:hypothetical protein